MAAASFPTALAFTLQSEGGWANNPDDPGGATMKGVTYQTFIRFFPGSSVEDLRHITNAQLQAIYKPGYWDEVNGDALPAGVDLSVFDFGVNAGPRRARAMLQRCVGVTADGILGPISMAAIGTADPAQLVKSLTVRQQAYYESLDSFGEFGEGWTRRTNEREAAALQLIGTPTS